MEEIIHENNVYAFDIKNNPKHISEVESGKKGYYCMGCGREMQAKKGEILTHHFAHDPKDVLKKGKCVYSDETYRHQLAKEILQRIRQIKVPALYKYPPPGVDGKPYKLKGSEFIFAETVKIELTFFENEEGLIEYGRDVNTDAGSGGEKFLLIRPDVTFFDENENPILLIEIVATHKINVEKLSKIKKLGINTIQVTIPKDSPEEIENTFFKTTRTQWIYNYEQEQTTYIPTSKGDDEGVPPLDEFQRKLFEAAESYECRASQINNLIRGLNKSLESQSYTDFKRHIGEEIRRVEGNTEGYRERLRNLQEGHEGSIKGEFRVETEDVAREEESLKATFRELDEKVNDYETRYSRKRKELERAQEEYRSEFEPEIERITGEFERLGTDAINYRKRSEEIRREENDLEQRFRSQINRIGEETRTERDSIAEIEQRRSGLSNKYVEIEQGIREDFERKGEEIERRFERRIKTAREEFERNRRESVEAIEARDCSRISRVERRIKAILGTRERLPDLSKGKVNLARMRKFKELFDQGAYKDWA